MISAKTSSALVGFYRWVEKQKNAGAILTTGYLNRRYTTTQSTSHDINRMGFSNSFEPSIEIDGSNNEH